MCVGNTFDSVDLSFDSNLQLLGYLGIVFGTVVSV